MALLTVYLYRLEEPMHTMCVSFRPVQKRKIEAFNSYSFLKTMNLASSLAVAQFYIFLSVFRIGVHEASYMQIRKCQFITVGRLLQQTNVKGSVISNDDTIVHILH